MRCSTSSTARWFIEDCGSRNGTSVNGQQLTSMHPLRAADEVRLGRARLVFCGQVSAGGNPTDAVVERPPVTAREHDVLVALCRPLANGDIFTEPATVREIAAALTVSENAIKLHLANLVGQVRHRRPGASALTPRQRRARRRGRHSRRPEGST